MNKAKKNISSLYLLLYYPTINIYFAKLVKILYIIIILNNHIV